MTMDQIRTRYDFNKAFIQQCCRAGDKIKVRSYEEIKETLNDCGDSLMSGLYFNYDEMGCKCGKYITLIDYPSPRFVKARSTEYDLDGYIYEWSYEWLDVKDYSDNKQDWEVVI